MGTFQLITDYRPKGDQPQAIEGLVNGIRNGERFQTLLGVTGSGKTFTMAHVIASSEKPTLIISHNKTLAAQLYSECKEFFPHNAVEYFVSYYDYYQPEAYIPQRDIYIEKDASINEELDRLRLAATSALMSRRDVIIIASVSCIYGLGSPEDYREMLLFLERGKKYPRKELLRDLVEIQYERNDIAFMRGQFRVKGEIVDIFPAYAKTALRIELADDEIASINEIDPLTSDSVHSLDKIAIYPAKHFVAPGDTIARALKTIETELTECLGKLNREGKILEAQRLESRTKYDMEMLRELGYCHGIENYSRHLGGREPGSRPYCLLDYFGGDFLLFIDESHVTIPQIGGMYNGDRSRKQTLVDYGFRLPSALDNRPLNFDEFESMIHQAIFVSATPGEYEMNKSRGRVVEQIIRPTGLVDPPISVRPPKHQIDEIIELVKSRARKKERVLIATLTKRMAEELTSYLSEMKLRVRYLHSELDAIERVKILRDLRENRFDCLIGINLLREGLDLPEVSLVVVLDADKEGFLRSQTSLIQVAGRAARNVNGEIILFAEHMTGAMERAIKEAERRRQIQLEYNHKHDIKPQTIQKAIRKGIDALYKAKEEVAQAIGKDIGEELDQELAIADLEEEMFLCARNLQFERAAYLRDAIQDLKNKRRHPGKKGKKLYAEP
ncbi:MAG: excinuclease ABC subunit UvrB [Candidatus Omnitrophica bacterium]|nr:excinuclease ABC subunit UvrB [Candidatus Omnitrophota bacterium]